MNILLATYSGKCTCRPDTTLNRENGDWYAPEDVVSVGFAPVVFARICKAGKAVSAEFASRYFDSINFGIMLYPATALKNGTPHYCLGTCSCFDHSSLLPMPLYNAITLGGEDNRFEAFADGREIFSTGVEGIRAKIEDAIVRCSAHTSMRNGDYIAVELAPVSTLHTREDGDCKLSATYCENTTIELEVKY